MKELLQNHFIETFEIRLENTKNREYLIENEIRQIEIFTSDSRDTVENYEGIVEGMNFNNETKSVFNLMGIMQRAFFNSAFHSYLLGQEFEDIIGGAKGIDEFEFETHQAILFADYYQWLKSLKLDSLQIQPKKVDFTHKQKVLALYYLGLDFNNPDVTNSALAKALGKILGLDEGNTRKYLTYVSGGENEVRTEKNLKAVQKLFLESNLNTYANVVEKELNSIKKKTIK